MNLWQAMKLWRKIDPVLDMVEEANMSKSLWKSKTFWVNLLGGLFELFQVVSQTNLIPPGTVAIILAALNVALRTITTQPVHIVEPKG